MLNLRKELLTAREYPLLGLSLSADDAHTWARLYRPGTFLFGPSPLTVTTMVPPSGEIPSSSHVIGPQPNENNDGH